MAPSTDPEEQLRRLLPQMRAQQTAREQHDLMEIARREQELVEVREQTLKLEALVTKLFDKLRAAGFPGGYPISKYTGWRMRFRKCWEIGLAYDSLSEHDIPDTLLLFDDGRLALQRARVTHLNKDRLPSAWYSLGRGRERRVKEDGLLRWDSSYPSPRASDILHLDGKRRK